MSKSNQANVNFANGREAAQARRKALSRAGKGAQAAVASAKKVAVQAAESTNAVHGMVCNEAPCLMTSQVNGRELALAYRRAASTYGKATASMSVTSQHSTAAALRKEQALARKGASVSSKQTSSNTAAALRKEQALARKAAAAQSVAPTQVASVLPEASRTADIVPVQAKVSARRPTSSASSAEALRKERALARKAAATSGTAIAATSPSVASQSAVQSAAALCSGTTVSSAASTPVEFVRRESRVNARQLRQEAAARKALTNAGRSAAAMRQQRRKEATRVAEQSVNPECGCSASQDALFAQTVVQTAVKSAIHPVSMQSSGRAFAMARRAAMSSKGKAGSGVVKAAAALVGRGLMTSESVGEVLTHGLNGRQVAMARRAQLSRVGARSHGKTSSTRPSGKTRAAVMKGEAVIKVEESETLKGQHVTGNIPGRSKKVTGNEPGSLRAITGTEYVGAEQFDTFGAKRPQAGVDKVVSTHTSFGKSVTGGKMFFDEDVTGTETGACRKITGTEYIAADVFKSVCGVKPDVHPQKVLGISTPKGVNVSGMPIVRSEKVTGTEVGAERVITGTHYVGLNDRAVNRVAAKFEKVGTSHTVTGNQPVTGTMVGHDEKMTGDEAGACASVSGTQYLSMESFKSYCRDVPYTPPAKTGRTMTASGQEVTGVMVGRKPTVTGDEAGSCREITGDQYFSVGEFGKLCTQNYPRKVDIDQTVHQSTVTGSAVDSGQRVTGGEAGGCTKVSGTQYVSPKTYRDFCQAEAPVPPRKVGEASTLAGQRVTGPAMGRAENMTGNESGACSVVTGTGYVGFEQMKDFCGPDELAEAAERAARRRPGVGHVMTGLQPGIGGVMTGAGRGACQMPSGTPYVGGDQLAEHCGIEDLQAQSPGAFSVNTPQHAARGRITGTAYGDGAQRITGPSNKADGRVSGTPEFRYQVESAAVRTASAAAGEEESAPAVQRERITGEGRQAGRVITGDDWQRSARITGTEGTSAHTRNLTLKGDVRGQRASNAYANREIQRPEAPTTRITGSAGATVKGPVVTLSGGARG